MRFLIALLALLLAVPAFADHTSFRVANNSDHEILSVYATSTQNRSFGYDLLGERTIKPGHSAMVYPKDNRGCMFDVAFTFIGRDPVNRRNLNLCEITVLSTTGRGVGVPRRHERPDTYRDFHTLYPGGPQVPQREPILREIPTFTRGTAI